jgi:murein DD-endopeptidase MepM/ murein hydrolase activator NlpD
MARAQVATQGDALRKVQASVARDMDALALRLGRLQAEAMRLNALGERLAKMGHLDDSEFNFSAEPALGGPPASKSMAAMSLPDVTSALDLLEDQLGDQAERLGVLEAVLLDEKLEQSLLPAGMPIRQGFISSRYGNRTDPFTGRSEFHAGVDFNGTRGQDILAVASGVVSFAGRKPGYGNVVEIDHGNGYMTRYAHNDRNVGEVGDPVKAGEVIAKMGASGRATGTHVHFEVWLNGRIVNPAQYITAIR